MCELAAALSGPEQGTHGKTKIDGSELADMDRCTVESNNSKKRHEGESEKITFVFSQ